MSKATYENGKLTIDIQDIFYEMDEGARLEFLKDTAYQSHLYKEIERFVIEDWASPSVNPNLHKLRVAFLQHPDAPKHMRRVVGMLLREIDGLKKEAERNRRAFWSLWRWLGSVFDHNTPPSKFMPDFKPGDYPTDEQIDAILTGDSHE